jgi:hypothetical protein
VNTRQSSWIRALTAAVAGGALCSGAVADPVLELVQLPVPGMIISVRIRDISATPVAGWQAFLEFDPSRLSFVSGAYVTTNFGLPVINPISTLGNHINLAAGIDPTLSQPPTNVNQDVAILVFAPVGTGCLPQIRIRPGTVPPSRLTNILGGDIVPLTINSPWTDCPADIDRSGFIGVQDIFTFLQYWFALDCRADFNNMSGVTVQDIFDFLAAWFAGCP